MSPVRTVLVPAETVAELAAALPVATELGRLEGAMVVQVSGPFEPFEASVLRIARERRSNLLVIACEQVPEQVVCDAPCPVVLVPSLRPAKPWACSAMLFPHDGAPSTAALFARGAALARSARARVHLLHVAGAATARSTEHGALTCPLYVDQAQHEWPAWQREFVQRFASLAGADPERIRFAMATGDPARAILAAADEHGVDLIALPWKGAPDRGRAKCFWAVLRGAPCPVMAVREVP